MEMKRALEAYDLKAVGKIMTANHRILIDMGLSHETLVYLCDKAIQLGALGAKVTGGGRGGYMVALTSEEAVQESVASAFEKEKFKVIRAMIG
jgi:mevalonate kinase